MSVLQDTIKKMNRKAVGQDNIFINNLYDKWLNTKICEEQSKLHGKKHLNKHLNKHLVNEDGQKANKHIERCSSFLIRKMKIKTMKRCHYTPIRKLKYKISTNKI